NERGPGLAEGEQENLAWSRSALALVCSGLYAVVPLPRCASETLAEPRVGPQVAHYLFNFVRADEAKERALRDEATGFLRARMWGIEAAERHRDELAAGDLVLIYLGAPERKFIGRAELASAVRDWTPAEA